MNSSRSRAVEPANAKAGHDDMSDIYGRRIEADRSWTVYHAFTGVPASLDGQAQVGLGRTTATDRMLAMNLRNAVRRRIRLDAPRLDNDEIGACRWR